MEHIDMFWSYLNHRDSVESLLKASVELAERNLKLPHPSELQFTNIRSFITRKLSFENEFCESMFLIYGPSLGAKAWHS